MKNPILALVIMLVALPSRADTLPATALDREYQSCMSGPANGLAEQKKEYCLCVRNKMAVWDISVFARIAQEMAATGGTKPPPELLAVAKECMAGVMK